MFLSELIHRIFPNFSVFLIASANGKKTVPSLGGKTAFLQQPHFVSRRRLPPKTKVQNRPLTIPSTPISMLSAAGFFGNPGMVIISPVRAMTKPAPAAAFT